MSFSQAVKWQEIIMMKPISGQRFGSRSINEMEPHYLFHSHLRPMSIMWRSLKWRSSFRANRPMVELRSSGDTMVEHLASRRRQLPAEPWLQWSCGVLELLPPPPLPAAPSVSIFAPPQPLPASRGSSLHRRHEDHISEHRWPERRGGS